jgi:D-gamma-glutamyl-meso-diaminopimelic acid endopeptidase CwlS
VGTKSLSMRLAAISVVGLAMVSGCTREKPLATPTPTMAVGETAILPSPTPAPTATPVPPEPTYHTVSPGDTAWAIANQHGVALDDLVAANELSNADSLQPGQRLIIPEDQMILPGPEPDDRDESAMPQSRSGEGHIHIVADGDTLWSIALQYDTGVDQLATLNGVDPDAILSLGQELEIP